ncbi:MAG: hypothetical protein BWY09_02543 [Candidatus Hydrogenedentes bacterium ADurb.Bin179]|nr:MAG: hypothetical protein BWY09_02543 [Candidatus Hydrogenedentes bacterium ADurb.Bin179]
MFLCQGNAQLPDLGIGITVTSQRFNHVFIQIRYVVIQIRTLAHNMPAGHGRRHQRCLAALQPAGARIALQCQGCFQGKKDMK